jgi:hypothetical protein
MSTLQNEAAPVIDSVNNPRHPFGLPLGTIRGTMSLLICSFFWAALLWPEPTPPKPLLAHYFMLALVLLVFSPYSKDSSEEGSRFVPRLMRVLAIGGSLAVLGIVAASHPERLNARLTPDPAEVKDWWGVFLATVACGFAVGNVVRLILGRDNPVFQTLRAWLSVVGLLMMAAELVMWVSFSTADNKQDEFLRFWQAFEMAFVSCYFGTRA